MSDSSQMPWSDNPNAPQVPHWMYFAEKSNFAGNVIGAICYGIVIVLFSQCMGALLNPVDLGKKGSIKWGLVAFASAMFTFATISTATNLDIQSISYINNREFTSTEAEGVSIPGPMGYQVLISANAINVTPYTMFFLNQWLADGLLLYRCYVIYGMNRWVIAFPCLMYLASMGMHFVPCEPIAVPWANIAGIVMGISLIYQSSQTDKSAVFALVDFSTPYYAVSVALNIILTLMLVIRFATHSRNIRKVTGVGAGGLYKTLNTMLIESCGLYAVTFILFIGVWGGANPILFLFFPILSQIQVIAPFFIILRVANRTALTSEGIVSGNIGSIRFGGGGMSTNGNATVTFPEGNTESLAEVNGETPSGFGAGIH